MHPIGGDRECAGVNQWDVDCPPRYLSRTDLSARVGALNPRCRVLETLGTCLKHLVAKYTPPLSQSIATALSSDAACPVQAVARRQFADFAGSLRMMGAYAGGTRTPLKTEQTRSLPRRSRLQAANSWRPWTTSVRRELMMQVQ